MQLLAAIFTLLVLQAHCAPAQARRRLLQEGSVCGTAANSSALAIYSLGVLRHVEGTGCPDYDWTTQKTTTPARAHTVQFLLPLGPTINSRPLPLSGFSSANGFRPTGVALNGIPFYGPADAAGQSVLTSEGADWDACGGHADAGGVYHYHVVPGAGSLPSGNLTLCPQIFWRQPPAEHSPLVGFMLDGVPVYGPLGDGGALPGDLDACNGHVDQSYAFYHYHATPGYPFLAGCLVGCVNATAALPGGGSNATCAPAADQYDYSSISTLSFGVIVSLTDPSSIPPLTSPVPASSKAGERIQKADSWQPFLLFFLPTLLILHLFFPNPPVDSIGSLFPASSLALSLLGGCGVTVYSALTWKQ